MSDDGRVRGMPNIGPLEIVIILVIVLLVFGAKRIPEVGRSLGKGIRGFKASLEGDKDDDDDDDDESEQDKPAQLPRPAQPTGKAADAKDADEDSPVRELR
jgi:sec-independent protein translocase protein TatA